MSKPPKKKAFETKKQYERRVKAHETLSGLVQGGTKKAAPRQTYQVTCGHCKGGGVIGGGKQCRNCGGSGKITRG